MVKLEFDALSPSLLDEDGNDIEREDPAVLEQTALEAKIRLWIDGVELLEWDGPGYPIPLLHAVSVGLRRVQELARSSPVTYDIPGDGYIPFTNNYGFVKLYTT